MRVKYIVYIYIFILIKGAGLNFTKWKEFENFFNNNKILRRSIPD